MATKRQAPVEPMRDVHVVPHYDGWATKRDGGVRVSRLADSQEDAIEFGKRLAKRDKVNLVVHGADGEVQLRCSFGPSNAGVHQVGVMRQAAAFEIFVADADGMR